MNFKGRASLDSSLARIKKFDNDRKDVGRAEGSVPVLMGWLCFASKDHPSWIISS